MSHPRQAAEDRRWRTAWILVLLTGLLMQSWFWLRSVWIYLDQVALYELGMALVRDGELVPFGKLSTGGLPIPGVALELLVGLPLIAWLDLRASTFVLIVFHLAAMLLLSRVLVKDFGWKFATIYLGVFWLSPWRLFHSGFLWETNYVLLPAAFHLTACRALKEEARFGASALLAATLVITAQIHASVLILVVACLVLLIRRQLLLNWAGAALGAALGAISLLPTVTAMLGGAEIPARPEAAADLLTRLNSVEKALVYWFRLGSLDVGRRFRQSMFCTEPGAGDTIPQPLLCGLVELTQILALASILVAVVAAWWMLRSGRARPTETGLEAPLLWYRDYTVAMLLAVVISALMSPVLIQGWHVLIALPIACLPVAAWITHRWPTSGTFARAIIIIYLVWHLPACLLLLGHPMYASPASPELPRHIAPIELRVLLPDDP